MCTEEISLNTIYIAKKQNQNTVVMWCSGHICPTVQRALSILLCGFSMVHFGDESCSSNELISCYDDIIDKSQFVRFVNITYALDISCLMLEFRRPFRSCFLFCFLRMCTRVYNNYDIILWISKSVVKIYAGKQSEWTW